MRIRKPRAEFFTNAGEETAFWLQFDPRVLRQHQGREYAGFQIQPVRVVPPHDPVALASVSLFLGLAMVDGRPALGLRVGIALGSYLPRLFVVNDTRLRMAVYRLLREWSGHLLILVPLPRQNGWPIAYFYLLSSDPRPASWRTR